MKENEIREQFAALYDVMAESGNVKHMRTFGCVMKKMIAWFAENKEALAEEFLGELCAIKWRNYLTKHDAETVVGMMNPASPWGYDAWQETMQEYGLDIEDEPFYNRYALWCAMSMVYSDSSETIAAIIGKPIDEISTETMLTAINNLALDKLTDKDEVFNIRSYFSKILD